tara:strand:- start:3228 stop:5066 length:1839 start_codon:yes stop_codon:yes gene_type:complete
MTDNLNDLFQNFGDKSLEELGSSLLNRQSEINRKQAKEDKKSERIGAVLATLGVGQKIFKNAYNKRMNELDKKEIFILGNNKTQQAEINNVSRIVKYLPDEEFFKRPEHIGKSSEELTKIYMEEMKGSVGGLEARFAPVVNKLLVNEFVDPAEFEVFKSTNEYKAALRSSVNTLVNDYFEVQENGKRKYMNFETDLRKLFDMNDPNFDKAELYKRGINLDVDELTSLEKRMLRKYRNNYENIGFRQGFKDMLGKIGLLKEEQGHKNLFKNVDKVILDKDILLTESLKNMNVSGHLIGDLDDRMAEYRTNNNQYKNRYLSDVKFQERIQQDMINFYDTSQQFNTGKNKINKSELQYDPNHILRIAGDDDTMNAYLKDIINSPDGQDFKELKNDVGQLSEAFVDDIEFATRAYIGSLSTDIDRKTSRIFEGDFGVKAIPDITLTEEKIKDFQNRISTEESFRNKFATALLVRHGMLRGKGLGWMSKERYAFNTEGKIFAMYQENKPTKLYDTNDSSIGGILGRGIEYDTSSQMFMVNEDWNKMNIKNRKLSFDTHSLNILKAPEESINTQNKLAAINKLFTSKFNPYKNEYENANEYLMENPKFINFLKPFEIE